MCRSGFRRLTVALALGGLIGGCDTGGEAAAEEDTPTEGAATLATTDLPAGVTAEEVELGRELFLPCAVCHGLDGRGNQLGPSLRDGDWVHITGSLQEIETLIRQGVPEPDQYPVPMVPMGGGDFDAEELHAVAAYVYAISRFKPSSTPP